MLEFVVVILFCWLLWKAVKLAFKVSWGILKLVACCLFVLAVPFLVVTLVLAGGMLLLIPLALVGASVALLKACI